jgi:tetratricopeptide (TPR) repeat protein
VLKEQGEVADAATTMNEAVERARHAVRLWPEDDLAHHDLGFALLLQGKRDEALAEHRETARLRPEVGGHHWNLGQILLEMGKYDEALAEFRVELQLEPDAQDVKGEVQKCERFVQLHHRLTSILNGTDRPTDAGERIELAELCNNKSLFRAGARFYLEVFAAKPALADDLSSGARYNAACLAARAARGQGKDDPPADEASRVVLRRQALDWLRSDLAAWVNAQKNGPSETRKQVAPTLRHWKWDIDLTGLRDEAELAKLPQAERDACRKLWLEVDQRLKEILDPANPGQ